MIWIKILNLSDKKMSSTFSDILKNHEQIMMSDADYKARTAKYPKLEDCLSIYIKQWENIICADKFIKRSNKI